MTVRALLMMAAAVAVSACGQSTAITGPSPSQVQSAVSAPSGNASVTVSLIGPGTNAGNGGAAATNSPAESFTPGSVTISPGMQVNFYNDDGLPHTIAADDGSWNSGNMDSETTFTVTFSNAGTFRFHDVAHPEIGGTVIVK